MLLPYSPAHLHTHYLGVTGQSMHHLQKRLTSDLLAEQRRVWMSSCQDDDFTRVQSCSLKGASEWLTDVRASLCMSDHDVAVAVNLRLGLPPSTTALPTTCVLCHCRVGDNHHLYCKPLLGEPSINAMTEPRMVWQDMHGRIPASCT